MDIIANHEDIPIIAIGDVHGDFSQITTKIKYYELENCALFQCGDFGVGFNHDNPKNIQKEKKTLILFNEFLNKKNIFLYVVRGNHDNPIFFDGNHNMTNIVFMKDYDIVEIGKHNVLGIGGATSVDRKPNKNFSDYNGKSYRGRKQGISWWLNEKVVYDEQKLSLIGGVDVVITHTSPDFAYPATISDNVLKWCEYDPELKEELVFERQLMTKIYKKLDEINVVKYWCFGHFHESKTEKHESTTFCLLDIGEFKELLV
ncbi:MAG: metallophosphoesterase [Candidatus Izemoplasmatales bacterium]